MGVIIGHSIWARSIQGMGVIISHGVGKAVGVEGLIIPYGGNNPLWYRGIVHHFMVVIFGHGMDV